MKKNIVEKLIEEDLVNYSTGNNGGSEGYNWHNRQRTQQVSMVDILKADRSDWNKAKGVIPHQIQTVMDRIIDMHDDLDSLKSDFLRAYQNPMIKDDAQKKEKIKAIVSDINKLAKGYTEIAKKMDGLQY